MNFETLKNIITHRRSTKPALMNGKKIEDAVIHQLLRLADWAPTHGHTEPWRFVVFAQDAAKQFCKDHAELYKANAPAEKFETAKYEKLLHNGDKVSHIIAVYMQRGTHPKITELEEICATAAAVENILLGAAALHLAVLWSTGGLTFHPAMKNYFGLQKEDHMLGLLYLGYSDETPKEGRRVVPLHEKAQWRK
ncbi:MAG TPA: nitroreductase [Chitinophagaceae bacterium]|nr:nitroreductase [Chitinophagaceae bacterium]